MPRVPHPFVLLSTVVCLGLVLAGCTSAPSGSAAPSSPTTTTSAAIASATPTSAASSASAAADAVTITITIKDGQVTPNGAKINVRQGQTVIERVTSDADDEIHAHTGGDGYELEVKAGQEATGRFVAGDVGSFEVESHHLGKIIAILVVR
jgi:hypothetical protein